MQKKIMWMILLSLGFMITMVSLFIWEYSIVQSLKEEEMLLRGEMQSWVKKGKQMTTFYSVLDEAKRVSGLLSESYFFPSEEEQIRFMTLLEQLAKKFSLHAEMRSLESTADYTQVSGVLACSGSYASVVGYIRALESFRYRLVIDDIDLSSKGESSLKPLQEQSVVYAVITFRILDINAPQI